MYISVFLKILTIFNFSEKFQNLMLFLIESDNQEN
jgi:hypothetical protein